MQERRLKITERLEQKAKQHQLLALNSSAGDGSQRDSSMTRIRQEPLFKKLENEYQRQEKSEYEQRKAHLKSLRSLAVPLHSEEWKK